jgi:hypothetical protein
VPIQFFGMEQIQPEDVRKARKFVTLGFFGFAELQRFSVWSLSY